jgi:hypothetical protein
MFDGMHVSALHAAVNSRTHLKVDLSRKEVLTLMALFTFWQCKIISPSYNLLLERCVGAKRSTMFTAMKSLEDRGLLIRRLFLDCKDGSRHVVFFLDLPGIFTDECCAQLDSDPKSPITTRHTIEVGRTASTEEILAMITFADVSRWQEIICTPTRKKSRNVDDMSDFLLPCPDNLPVREEEEPKPELCVAVSDGQGDLFDMLHEEETQEVNTKAKATRGAENEGGYGTSWPETAEVPGGSNWVPTGVEDTSRVSATPAAGESAQERAECIIRDHAGDDVIDAEIIDVEIVEDETPSDTLIDVPVSQELTIAAPAAPVKAKGNSEGDCEKEFAKFYEIFPRHVGRKPAFEAWKKVLKTGKKTAAELIKAAGAYAKSRAGKPKQYTLHPSTWLNQERWEDEYEEETTGYGYNGYSSGGIVARTPEDAEYFRNLDAACSEMYYKSHGFRTAEEFIEYQRGIAALNARQAEEDYAEAAANRIPF